MTFSAEQLDSAPVLFAEHKTANNKILAVACLNSPKTLNALSAVMIEQLLAKLAVWLADPDVVAIVLKGAGDKAFCAGGDVVSIYHDLKQRRQEQQLVGDLLPESVVETSLAKHFFTLEYQLDLLVHQATKPIVALLNGYTMGGGIGIMAGASHRIGATNSVLSMPEISIGLYPDVAASWFLNQMSAGVGLFLGLTGAFINAADGQRINLVDEIVEPQRLQTAISDLLVLNWQAGEQQNHQLITEFFAKHRLENRQELNSNLVDYQPLFNQLANCQNAEQAYGAIIDYQDEGFWFNKARNKLIAGSPLSAHIIFEQLKRCQELSLEQCFAQELRLSLRCCQHTEFVEGVRALLVDKDNKPKWQYQSLEQVEKSQLDWFFRQ